MWPFRRKGASSDPPDLRERVAVLERDTKNLRLEWEDAYEKFVHLMRRLNKRDARAADEPVPERAAAAVGDPNVNESFSRAQWTPQQLQVQKQIDARRARGLGTFSDVSTR